MSFLMLKMKLGQMNDAAICVTAVSDVQWPLIWVEKQHDVTLASPIYSIQTHRNRRHQNHLSRFSLVYRK